MRRLCAGLLVVLLGFAAPADARAQDLPILPIRAYFSHWDHHWFIWLPRHPVYEAVEIHSEDRPDGVPPLVWVYFTERAAPKRQVNFVNDPDFARANGWIHRDIKYTTFPGGSDRPLAVAVDLDDDKGRPVVISVEFGSGQKMAMQIPNAGQMGHGAEHTFLALHRVRGAATTLSRVTIDGGPELSELTPEQPNPLPFRAAYANDTYNAALLYIARPYFFGAAPQAGGGRPPDVFLERPAPTPHQRLFVARQGENAAFELLADSSGRVDTYISRRGDHLARLRFDPPLPSAAASDPGRSRFALNFNDFPDLITGIVSYERIGGEWRLLWQPDSPEWTRASRFESRIAPNAAGAMLAVTPARPPAP